MMAGGYGRKQLLGFKLFFTFILLRVKILRRRGIVLASPTLNHNTSWTLLVAPVSPICSEIRK